MELESQESNPLHFPCLRCFPWLNFVLFPGACEKELLRGPDVGSEMDFREMHDLRVRPTAETVALVHHPADPRVHRESVEGWRDRRGARSPRPSARRRAASSAPRARLRAGARRRGLRRPARRRACRRWRAGNRRGSRVLHGASSASEARASRPRRRHRADASAPAARRVREPEIPPCP